MASSASLKATRRTKISSRDTYIKRKQGIDNIVRKINMDIDNYILDVNNAILSCASMYAIGLQGKKTDIAEHIASESEQYGYLDGKIVSCKEKLVEESDRCQSEIDALNLEISSLDSQIRAAEAREEEERKKALLEYLASLTGGDKE